MRRAYLLEGEVCNGGFDQYFFNNSGSYYAHAVKGLMAIEAQQSLSLLREAKEVLFPRKPVPENTEVRRKDLPKSPPSGAPTPEWSRKLEELDKLFWKDPDDLWPRLESFAKVHGLVPSSPNPTVDPDARKGDARRSP